MFESRCGAVREVENRADRLLDRAPVAGGDVGQDIAEMSLRPKQRHQRECEIEPFVGGGICRRSEHALVLENAYHIYVMVDADPLQEETASKFAGRA